MNHKKYYIKMTNQLHDITQKYSQRAMREKCPNTEFFLVRIFVYSLRIEKTPYLYIFRAVDNYRC